MKDKDKVTIQQEILRKYPGTDPEMDIDWDIMDISFKAGETQGIKKGRTEVVEKYGKVVVMVILFWILRVSGGKTKLKNGV